MTGSELRKGNKNRAHVDIRRHQSASHQGSLSKVMMIQRLQSIQGTHPTAPKTRDDISLASGFIPRQEKSVKNALAMVEQPCRLRK
jgi:hypothetical protein